MIPNCSVSEKFMDEMGVITFFRWKFFVHSVESFRRGTLVFQKCSG